MSSSPSGRRDPRRSLLLPEPPPLDEDQTAWLLTFSDLVLQLFAFVMVAVVLGNAKQSARPPVTEARPALQTSAEWSVVQLAGPETTAPTAAAADEPVPAPAPPPVPPQGLRERIESELHADGVSVTVRDSDVVLTLSDRITFPSGSADLLSAARPLLERIGTLAAALPDCSIEVAG